MDCAIPESTGTEFLEENGSEKLFSVSVNGSKIDVGLFYFRFVI